MVQLDSGAAALRVARQFQLELRRLVNTPRQRPIGIKLLVELKLRSTQRPAQPALVVGKTDLARGQGDFFNASGLVVVVFRSRAERGKCLAHPTGLVVAELTPGHLAARNRRRAAGLVALDRRL